MGELIEAEPSALERFELALGRHAERMIILLGDIDQVAADFRIIETRRGNGIRAAQDELHQAITRYQRQRDCMQQQLTAS